MMSEDFFEMMKLIVIAHNFSLEEVFGIKFVRMGENPTESPSLKDEIGKNNGDGTGGSK